MSVQLDLFEGKILTTEQQSEIISYIEKCDKEVVRKQNENRATMLLLDEAVKFYLIHFEMVKLKWVKVRFI